MEIEFNKKMETKEAQIRTLEESLVDMKLKLEEALTQIDDLRSQLAVQEPQPADKKTPGPPKGREDPAAKELKKKDDEIKRLKAETDKLRRQAEDALKKAPRDASAGAGETGKARTGGEKAKAEEVRSLEDKLKASEAEVARLKLESDKPQFIQTSLKVQDAPKLAAKTSAADDREPENSRSASLQKTFEGELAAKDAEIASLRELLALAPLPETQKDQSAAIKRALEEAEADWRAKIAALADDGRSKDLQIAALQGQLADIEKAKHEASQARAKPSSSDTAGETVTKKKSFEDHQLIPKSKNGGLSLIKDDEKQGRKSAAGGQIKPDTTATAISGAQKATPGDLTASDPRIDESGGRLDDPNVGSSDALADLRLVISLFQSLTPGHLEAGQPMSQAKAIHASLQAAMLTKDAEVG